MPENDSASPHHTETQESIRHPELWKLLDPIEAAAAKARGIPVIVVAGGVSSEEHALYDMGIAAIVPLLFHRHHPHFSDARGVP